MKEFLSVGQIINTHGVKGELKVLPLTDDLNRFKKLSIVYVNGSEKKVLYCKIANDKIILKLDGIDTLEDAAKYVKAYIEVTRKDAAVLPNGHYFIADLIGCSVYDTNELFLGKISSVIQTGSNDVYWVKDNDKEVLIPALKRIVLSIDVLNEKIIVIPEVEW